MAAGLERSNDMAFAGELPWHRLGVQLPGLATAKEMLAAVPALAASIVKEPVLRKGTPVSGKYFTIRQDTDTVLGIVGSDYRVLQNCEAFEIMDAITMDRNGPKYETAGVLWGGRRVWALARVPEFLEVVPGDALAQYLLCANSHDGSSAALFMETPVRVVCQNTLSMATSGGGKSKKLRHSGNLFSKVSDVQDVLKIVRSNFLETLEQYRALANDRPTNEEVESVLKSLFPDTKTDRAVLQRNRVKTLWDDGIGQDIPDIAGTAWALYNGVTELIDHHANAGSKRDDADDMRLNSIWFGSGAAFKQTALDTISEVCLK